MISPCAGAQVQRPATATDSLGMAVAIYTALFTKVSPAMGQGVDVVCVEGLERRADPPRGLVDTLQRGQTPVFRPASACRADSVRTRGIPLHIDTLSGKRGIRLANTRMVFSPDRSFTASMMYNRGVTWGAMWSCSGRRNETGGWTVTGCRAVGAS